ncbi:MAG: NAD(P)-dependent oxidoreductase [Bacteroidota bacterium]|jgi:D-3-phosphoglycerate dehydrogenase
MSKKILLVDSNHAILHETLIAAGFLCDLFWDKPKDELIKLMPNYEAIVIRSKFKITKELIDDCPKLKCIGRVGAGMENIDVEYAKRKGITCLHAPEGNRDAVAEHAMGMLLMLLNNLKTADIEVRAGIWKRIENRGYEIKDKIVGIIGYGNMGSEFANRLRSFGCKILVYDKYKSGFGNEFIAESSLKQIQEAADIVSLHTPLTPETNYFINDDFIKAFKKDIYIINTARGKCLNVSDLVIHLKSGKVKGACLDVLEYESSSFENMDLKNMPEPLQYLIHSNKVILTPHIAGWTHESNYKMSKIIANKIIDAMRE